MRPRTGKYWAGYDLNGRVFCQQLWCDVHLSSYGKINVFIEVFGFWFLMDWLLCVRRVTCVHMCCCFQWSDWRRDPSHQLNSVTSPLKVIKFMNHSFIHLLLFHLFQDPYPVVSLGGRGHAMDSDLLSCWDTCRDKWMEGVGVGGGYLTDTITDHKLFAQQHRQKQRPDFS